MAKDEKGENFEQEMDELAKSGTLTTVTGIDITGLEDVPASIIPLPYVRLVQPTSTKIQLDSGEDAAVGTFYFNDTQRAEVSISMAILKAKHGQVTYERNGEPVHTSKLAVLGYDLLTNKLFILSLSVMSFSNFGKLVAQMKEKAITQTWTHEIIVSSEKQENEKGKYYVAKFEIGQPVQVDKKAELDKLQAQYEGVLERRNEEDQI